MISIGLFDGAVGAAIGAIGSIGGSMLTNRANKKESDKNRRFQENMSNTAVQRRAADLKAAGMNPVLAAGNPASDPTGNVANQDYSGIGDGIANAMQFAMQKKANEANVKNVEANTQLINDKRVTEGINQSNMELEGVLKAEGITEQRIINKIRATENEAQLKELFKQDKELKGLDIDIQRKIFELERDRYHLDLEKKMPTNDPDYQWSKEVANDFSNINDPKQLAFKLAGAGIGFLYARREIIARFGIKAWNQVKKVYQEKAKSIPRQQAIKSLEGNKGNYNYGRSGNYQNNF